MRFAATVSLGIGLLMLAQWLFFLGAGQAPELETRRWRACAGF